MGNHAQIMGMHMGMADSYPYTMEAMWAAS